MTVKTDIISEIKPYVSTVNPAFVTKVKTHLLNILQRHRCCLGKSFQMNSMNGILNNQASNVKPPAMIYKLLYFWVLSITQLKNNMLAVKLWPFYKFYHKCSNNEFHQFSSIFQVKFAHRYFIYIKHCMYRHVKYIIYKIHKTYKSKKQRNLVG